MSLSPAQITFYGRRWGSACTANHWRMARGRLSEEADLSSSEHHLAVAALAEEHAQRLHRAVTIEDLRKGVTHHVIGKFGSVKEFTNKQFDRLLCLIGDGKEMSGLLCEPACVASLMRWEEYREHDAAAARGVRTEDTGARRRLVASITGKAPAEYICAIARLVPFAGRFEYPYWENLPLPLLYALQAKVSDRVEKWHEPVLPDAQLEVPF